MQNLDVRPLEYMAQQGASTADIAASLGWSLGDWQYASSINEFFRTLDGWLWTLVEVKRFEGVLIKDLMSEFVLGKVSVYGQDF